MYKTLNTLESTFNPVMSIKLHYSYVAKDMENPANYVKH